MDFILNDTTLIITPDVSQGCLQFKALDDDSVEDSEQVVMFTVMGDITNIIGLSLVDITDNDGMAIIIIMCMCELL